MELDMVTSFPPFPFSTHYDDPTPSSHWGMIDLNEHSNGLVDMLIARLSELAIESHLEAETTKDMDNDTIAPDSTGTVSDDSSDEDWMDEFYDMDLDEELHETYQMGKCLGYMPLITYSNSYSPLGIECLSDEDIDSIKMFSLIREGHISCTPHSKIATSWGTRLHTGT